jgi:hydrogenase small subunit
VDDIDFGLERLLARRGVSRRSFLRFSAAMAAALMLPPVFGPKIARALSTATRIPVIWLEGQDCAGNTEAFLRASHPTVAELVLDTLSVDYHETIMAAAGVQAEDARAATVSAFPNGYIAVVEGGIPLSDGGIYCTVGGRAFVDIVKEVCGGALATIAVGSCAFDGGLPHANGGPTGATGVSQVVPGAKVINLPGCPMNVQNLTATIVHYLTFKEFPATDTYGRPLFAYGQLIHDQCERRAHFDAGRYVQAWGDEGHRQGWCLYRMGCKGPETFSNCPTAMFNDATSWPVKAGHGCVGCTMPDFWDQMSPFYKRLASVPGFPMDVTADQVGAALVAGVAGLTAVHAGASYVRHKVEVGRATTPESRPGGEPVLTAAASAGTAAASAETASTSPAGTSGGSSEQAD